MILGLVCFLSIVWAVVSMVRKNIGKIHEDPNLFLLQLGIFAGLIAFLVQSFFDTNLYSLKLSGCFWYMIGMIVVIDNLLHKSASYGIKKG